MDITFYVGLKINNYYVVHINEDGYEHKEIVDENDIDGFIQCLRCLGYKES